VSIPNPWILDFETEAIGGRPDYPPVPVSFSIQSPRDEVQRFYAWGHPTENNCTYDEAVAVLHECWDSGEPILFHNMKFDIDVAQHHMGCGDIEWQRVHDTMFLLFLMDPHARLLSLKPSAEKLLNMPPDEQDAVRDWLVANGVCNDTKGWGAFICKAPGSLVGTYAEGDVIRTKLLFELLYPQVVEAGMLSAYDRERELMFILLQNEREGVRVDLKLLKKDLAIYEAAMGKVEAWVRERLGVAELNLDAAAQVANALDASGVVTQWHLTKTGKRSTAKDKMTPDMFTDERVSQALGYRSRLSTLLGTFMRNWYDVAVRSNGIIYTNWSQVRQPGSGDGSKGARTGRMSSSPPFMNIAKDLEEKSDGYVHPAFLDVPELPAIRKYILPDHPGDLILHRDYSQQELRVLAHMEDGDFMAAYVANPAMDVHEYVRQEIKRLTGVEYTRSQVKQVNFGIIYGMGYGALAKKLDSTVDVAKDIKTAQRRVLPGVASLEKSIKKIGGSGGFITTWGGRRYFVEEPKIVKGAAMSFEYKLLNYLIQGSAADITKQALINYHKMKKHGRFLITVHDEINISVPKEYADEEMEILKKAMNSVPLDVPLLSDGKVGPNWGNMKKFVDKE
jgi:DNA polymerase-1